MSKEKGMDTSEEKLQPRVRLGPKAHEVAQAIAGGEKISSAHLEAAILNLIESKPPEATIPVWVKNQLQLINETLISMRYMIQALSANTSEEVEITIERMNSSINKKQLKSAEESGLDHPALKKIQEKINEVQQRQYFEEQQSRQDQEIERD